MDITGMLDQGKHSPVWRHLGVAALLVADEHEGGALHGGQALVLRPFWWPMNMKEVPSMEARPQTMAGSSRPARSPCSSTNLSLMLSAMSRKVGRLGCRATCRRCTGVRRV